MIESDSKMICGKCKTEQEMTKVYYGKKEDEYSFYCPKCDDLINKGVCRSLNE